MSEEVGRERLVHEGMPDGQKTSVVSEGSDLKLQFLLLKNNYKLEFIFDFTLVLTSTMYPYVDFFAFLNYVKNVA